MDPYIELDPETGRIFLFADYEPGIGAKCKKVVGYKWHPDYDRKPWSYPLRMQTCHALREVWGKRMKIGPRLTEWARAEAAKYSELRQMARLPDSDLERVKERFPAMWEAMSRRTYQRSGADFLARVLNGADFDDPGLGKSLTALAAIVQADRWDGRHLVIAPKTAIFSTWEREIQKWTDGRVYGMPDGKARREDVLMDFIEDDKPGARFLVVHPHMIQIKIRKWCKDCKAWEGSKKQGSGGLLGSHYSDVHRSASRIEKCDWPELFEKNYWDSIIADECQGYMLKLRPSTGRKPEAQPQWAHGLRALMKATKSGGLRIPLTGTPFRGREENVFGILHWLDPVKYSSFWGWAGAYLEVEDEEHSGWGDTHKVVGRLKPDREQAFYDDLDAVALRRTRGEVRADLPELDPQPVWVPLEGEHRRQYEEFAKQGIAQLESGVVEGLGVLSELTRMRQFAFGPCDVEYRKIRKKNPETDRLEEHMKILVKPVANKSPKVAWLLDALQARGIFGEFESGDRKVVIASQFTQVVDAIEMLFQDLKVPTLKITGAVTGKRRDAAVTTFRAPGGPRILLLNTTAGGTSLTLDEFCDEMFVLDETWVHDDQVQLMNRINNRGQDIRPRTVYFIRTVGTIEEEIALKNDSQNEMQSRILDRRRGVKVALSLLEGKRAS